MKKLVIEYTDSDGCTYFCDITVCVLYESAEAFIAEFEKQLKLFMEKDRIFREKRDEWHKHHNAYDAQDWAEFIAECPPVFGDIQVGGASFSWQDFVNDGKMVLPDVYELNEWFDVKVSE